MFPSAEYKSKDSRVIKVRLATPDDYDDAIETWASVTREKIYLLTEELRPNTKETWTERWINNGKDAAFAVAEIEGRIAGGAVLTKYSDWEKTKHVREFGTWIDAEHREKGIGKALMDYLLRWAKENGTIRKIILQVWSTNTRALNYYMESGFHIEGAYRNIAIINGKLVDEVLMGLEL